MAPGSSARLDILCKGETTMITLNLVKIPNETPKLAQVGDPEQESAKGIPNLGLSSWLVGCPGQRF
jgi:serine protease Do